MSERKSCPPSINDCACGANMVREETDGISARYTCDACGTFLGDVIEGAEP